MTPSEAAEGRRLLDKRQAAEAVIPDVPREQSSLLDWLWANREELVRCAELAARLKGATAIVYDCKGEEHTGCGVCFVCTRGAPQKPEQET